MRVHFSRPYSIMISAFQLQKCADDSRGVMEILAPLTVTSAPFTS